jgi:hypothetical protein
LSMRVKSSLFNRGYWILQLPKLLNQIRRPQGIGHLRRVGATPLTVFERRLIISLVA